MGGVMAELKWTLNTGAPDAAWRQEWNAGRWMVLVTHSISGARLYLRGGDGEPWASCDSLDAAQQLAQRIENVLDPPECPTKHTQFLWNEGSGGATSQDGVTRFESESHEVRQPWRTTYCPDCGRGLSGNDQLLSSTTTISRARYNYLLEVERKAQEFVESFTRWEA